VGRFISFFLAGAFVIAPTAAFATTDPPSPPPSLSELRQTVEREIGLLTGSRPIRLAPKDQAAYLQHELARAQLFIGTIRVQAHRALEAAVPDADLAAAIRGLDGGSTPDDVATALETTMFPTSATQQFAVEWVALYQAIDRLRSVIADGPRRVCPVAGPTSFVDDFSEPRSWGRTHTGIDLNGALGTPLQAVEAGTVIQANWHWAGGRQVWIRADATGDVYYYAHLDTWAKWIWTGTRVVAGDVIGTMGWSGDADASHLHFGWMPGSNTIDLDNLQDAYSLLVELCQR
jgi:murein DD-endopeptidase MepM/ murein hydrolase activator NlpD